MRNFRNIFKEYNDPRVFTNLKIGFLCLIVLGVAVFLAVPDIRHSVGIGEGHPVQSAPPVVVHRNDNIGNGANASHNGAKKVQYGSQSQKNGTKGLTPSNPSSGLGGTTQPPGSGRGNPTTPTPPTSQPTQPSAPSNPTGGNGSNDNGNRGGDGGVNPQPNSPSGNGGIEVEAEVTLPGVNGAVGGVTGTVNEITNQLPVPIEVDKVCLLKC